MKKLCGNMDREDALETVLEVPLPEEMFPAEKGKGTAATATAMATDGGDHAWLKSQPFDRAAPPQQQYISSRSAELQLLLNVVGSPLIPMPVPFDAAFNLSVRESSIQASTAKYILQQYIAATGGQAALTSMRSMYALGKVRMSSSEFHMGSEISTSTQSPPAGSSKNDYGGEIGGFVLWQKTPELWFFELIIAGCKMTAGCNGKFAWRQSTAEQSHAFRGAPRPLRRSLQGLDPRSTANLFVDAVCIGEKIINGTECFILKLEASASVLKARSGPSFGIIRHTIWGYFNQRTGLLVQLEDSHLVRMKASRGKMHSSRISSAANDDVPVFWETSMESVIDDYRYIDGVNIAHGGRSVVTLFRYGEGSINHKCQMEECWTIEEVDFNLHGLTTDYFIAPSDLRIED